jgi:hypothetical protein
VGDDKPNGFCWDFAAARHCTRSLLDTVNSGRGSKRSGTACSREWETKWTSPFLSLKSMSVCPVTCHYLFDATKDQTDQTPLMGKRACTAWGRRDSSGRPTRQACAPATMDRGTRSNPDFTILQIPQELQSHNTYRALRAHVTNALRGVERA